MAVHFRYLFYLFIYLEGFSCTYLLRGLAELEFVCFGEPLLIFFFFNLLYFAAVMGQAVGDSNNEALSFNG